MRKASGKTVEQTLAVCFVLVKYVTLASLQVTYL